MIDDKTFLQIYNKRLDIIEGTYNEIVSKLKKKVAFERGKYNYASPLVLILKSKEQLPALDIYDRAVFSKRKIPLSDLYVTVFEDTDNEEINKEILKKHLEAFSDSIIILHNIWFDGLPSNVVYVDADSIIRLNTQKDMSQDEKKNIAVAFKATMEHVLIFLEANKDFLPSI